MQHRLAWIIALLAISSAACDDAGDEEDDAPNDQVPEMRDHRIFLERRAFVPRPNIARFLETGRRHGIAQFRSLPRTLGPLRGLGVRIHGALRNDAYYVTVPEGVATLELRQIGIRALFALRPLDKISTDLVPLGSSSPAGTESVRVELHFIPKTDRQNLLAALTRVGATVLTLDVVRGRASLDLPLSELLSLAREGWVSWVEATTAVSPDLDVVTERIQADDLQPAPWGSAGGSGLTGNGVVVGVWEADASPPSTVAGVLATHPDLAGRVSFGPGQSVAPSFHATHVAGVVAGDGSASEDQDGDPFQWAGVAPEAEIVSWDATDSAQEMAISLLDFGTVVTTHSFGPRILGPQDCAVAGNYTSDAMDYDEVVADFGVAAFVSPSNNGELLSAFDCSVGVWDDGVFVQLPPEDIDDGFGSVSGIGVSKNGVAVGGRRKATPPGVAAFSGRGPARDGRLKPDVVGISGDDEAEVVMPSTPEVYAENSGVSFAVPQAGGGAALLLEHYREDDPGFSPNPAVFKAVLANTAADVGNDNPDYSNGFGLLQLAEAVSAADSFTSLQIGQGEIGQFQLDVDVGDACAVRVMAAWNDPPSLGFASMELINDVDLSVQSGSEEVLPWVLTPSSPRNPAMRGVNSRDNVEQVTVDSPTGTELVTLVGTSVMMGPQEVVLHWYAVPCDAGGESGGSGDGGDGGDPGCPCGAKRGGRGGFVYVFLGFLFARRRQRSPQVGATDDDRSGSRASQRATL